ncbi:hypothetical protein ABTP16_15245 [Acinetobacter baumannii]
MAQNCKDLLPSSPQFQQNCVHALNEHSSAIHLKQVAVYVNLKHAMTTPLEVVERLQLSSA